MKSLLCAPILFVICVLLNGPVVAIGREAWTASKFVGSPEPPLPYRWQRVHEELELKGAISIHRVPGTSKFLVLEHNGAVYQFDDRQQPAQQQLVVDFSKQLPASLLAAKEATANKGNVTLFSCAFDPSFDTNGFVYFCLVWNSQVHSTTHISRFKFDTESETKLNIDTEFNILTCDGGGHNGCHLLFGPDQMLYVSIGDLGDANPPDGRKTGQDISDLYASILRIDIRNSTEGQPYRVPSDNPFVMTPNARPEVYAYGLRNPFRIAFDPAEGTLWVGDVGWESWELVYRIQSGGNYGWSVKEGTGDVQTGTLGPTPILAPDLQLPHSIAASITGGIFYQGNALPELKGCYVFGDWVTRKFWSVKPDRSKPLELIDAAEGELKPICFELDQDGEVLCLDFNEAYLPSGIYRLVRNKTSELNFAAFPTRLSETGLYRDVVAGIPAEGVFRYSINEPMWMDNATAEFLLAIPGDGQAEMFQQPVAMFNWYMTSSRFPVASVLAKTYSIETIETKVKRRIRVETQIAVKDEKSDWQYYTYRWNEDNTDAFLVPKTGDKRTLHIVDRFAHKGQRTVDWNFAARSQCKVCHSPWTGEAIGFIEPQLRNPIAASDSWRQLFDLGVLTEGNSQKPRSDHHYHGLVSSKNIEASIADRARAYLHANCSHCHILGGNASTSFNLRFENSLKESKIVDAVPMRGSMGIDDAKLISPGDPAKSVLWLRMAKSGMGHMPHIGVSGIDHDGVQLMRQWILSIDRDEEHRDYLDRLSQGSFGWLEDEHRVSAADKLLSDPKGTIKLSMALSSNAVVPWIRTTVIERALKNPGSMRELIEPFAPAELQVKRLGNDFDLQQVLSLTGDRERGRDLFRSGAGTCSSCHALEGHGKAIGPDLSNLSNVDWDRVQVLTQIVKPSAEIHPKFKMQIVLTMDGTVIQGTVLDQTDTTLTLIDANGKAQIIESSHIEEQRQASVSMMPENLLSSLTSQQAADLLDYIFSFHRKH